MTTTTEDIKNTDTSEQQALQEETAKTGSERAKAKYSIKLNQLKPFSKEITEVSGEIINNCYQCKKCSNGCPITFAMDYQPHQIIRMIQLGMEEKVLSSKTIWLCSACETCGTRCPNEIKLADMMDALRQRAERSSYKIGNKTASVFHKAFISSIEKYGRVFEVGMVKELTLKSGGVIGKIFSGALLKDAGLGMKMYKRGKLHLSARKIKGVSEVKKIIKNSQKD